MTTQKAALRRLVLARRRAMEPEVRQRQSRDIGEHLLDWLADRRARTVCAYLAMGTEPGSIDLLDALRRSGREVLLPICSSGVELDWAVYTGPEHLVEGTFGSRVPTSPRLGSQAVTRADVVVVPALAVDHAGHRLGRGGGFYDRSLALLAPRSLAAAVLFTDEMRETVPAEPHDQSVSVVLTPDGVITLDPEPPSG